MPPPDCRDAIVAMLARHDWQLLSGAELTRRANDLLAAGRATTCPRAAILAYTLERYAACAGTQGQERQNRAYYELHTDLYHSALHHSAYTEDAAHELAQQTIYNIYQKFDKCREPGAFLAFALQELRNVAKKMRRASRRFPPVEVGDNGELIHALVSPNPDPQALMESYDNHERLHGLVQNFMRRHPRAYERMTILLLHYYDSLTVTEVKTLLHKNDENNILTTLSRIRAQLRDDRDWHQFAKELGVL